MPYAMLLFSCGHKGGPVWKASNEEVKALVAKARTMPCFNCKKEASMTSNPRRRARPRKKVIIRPPNYAPNRARRNPMPIGIAWTGHKANFISPKGNYGIVPSSELAMSTRIADKPVIQFALFSDAKRWPHVTWAHVMTPDGFVTDGLPSEVLPAEVRRMLGFGNEKMPKGASRKTQYVANPRASDDNPKKVHTMMVRAFLDGRKASAGPRYRTDGKTLWVWGNVVAAKQADGIMLRDAGWRTLLTKNVLNELLQQMGIPGSIGQVKHVWMLGGKPWPGSVVAPYKTLPKPVNGMATNPRSGRRNPVVDGTTYKGSAPRRVIEILEANRINRGPRLRIWYGDAKTGAAWGDTEAGHVGRSTGSIKIPLVISKRTSMGGGGILDACIVRIEHASKARGGVLYQHPRFHVPAGKTPWIKRNPCGTRTNELRQYAVFRFRDPTMKTPKWGAVDTTGPFPKGTNWRDFLPPSVLSDPGILGFCAHGKHNAIEKGKEEFARHGGKPRRNPCGTRPNPLEYRTVDTRTVKGIEAEEKLQREGWSMGRVGLLSTQFYRRKCKKCGGWMKTQGKWKGVEKFECGKCGNEDRRRCEMNPVTKSGIFYGMIEPGRWFVEAVHGRRRMSYTERPSARAAMGAARQMQRTYTRLPVRAARNPLTRKESASLLRDAKWRSRLSGSFSRGEASGMARAVKRYGPTSARRSAYRVVAAAHGFGPKETKYDPAAWPNPRSCKMCGGPLIKMGGLGNLMWYRCRNCGMETSVKK
jgi:hypothetical protein